MCINEPGTGFLRMVLVCFIVGAVVWYGVSRIAMEVVNDDKAPLHQRARL